MRYLTIIEKTKTGYSAYSPDLPGCVSTGLTYEEVEQNMREAIEFHLDGLKLEGYKIPKPSTSSTYIEVAA
ncbi:type II toxin-antitoxin system HicB family antitoxin [Acaryochloris sp. 'Moss Beach']|uniref:type II toxin-antitoxin system HicB family antitoxin n=1 Tax=Acaryochloris sp. 'Moss Beach' TaxID=2740837 RepID=UPI001F255380|nr:type II toxin-antitoxin system HicB family antitoxin [Acaryochloris sp. 'Moss Beach']UJB68851.1 type II toxin-antitoxin system HicB family antitoxin [Acaryochloris sp. 'Moss Beach']